MAAPDLSRVLAAVPDQYAQWWMRVLGDVYEGILFTSDSGLDMHFVPRGDRATYFDCFRGLHREGWVMEDAPGRGGLRKVIPTSIGEAVHRRSNLDAYQSRHAFEIRNGKVQATEVAR